MIDEKALQAVYDEFGFGYPEENTGSEIEADTLKSIIATYEAAKAALQNYGSELTTEGREGEEGTLRRNSCPPVFASHAGDTTRREAVGAGEGLNMSPAPASDQQVDRTYPRLFSDDEKMSLLEKAKNLWRALEENQLGGFSGINRPFLILHEFKEVIEQYGERDVGLTWSANDLRKAKPTERESVGLQVGEFNLFRRSADKVAIHHASGEGGDFSETVLAEAIQTFYVEHF